MNDKIQANKLVAFDSDGNRQYVDPHYDSRTADKFVVRLEHGQRDRLKARAKADHQSMNDAVVTAIDKHLDQGAAFDELLRILGKAIKSQGGEIVSIKRGHLWKLLDCTTLSASDSAIIAAAAALQVRT